MDLQCFNFAYTYVISFGQEGAVALFRGHVAPPLAPLPLHCQALRSKAAGQEAIAGAAMASRAAGVVIKAEPERRGEEVGAGVTKTERGFGVSWSK